MADNFTKFSFLIKNATKKEVAWLKEALAYDFEDEQQKPFLLEMLHTSRGLESTFEYWPDFDHVLPDLTSRDPRARSLWVYAPESGNPWTAAVLVHAFLSKFRPNEIVRFSVAYTCSRMRPDEFSGEDFIVTANGIFRTGGIGIKMCEALAAQQQQRIRWDGLDIIVRPRKASKPGRKVR
jgi:hypothetical protein